MWIFQKNSSTISLFSSANARLLHYFLEHTVNDFIIFWNTGSRNFVLSQQSHLIFIYFLKHLLAFRLTPWQPNLPKLGFGPVPFLIRHNIHLQFSSKVRPEACNCAHLKQLYCSVKWTFAFRKLCICSFLNYWTGCVTRVYIIGNSTIQKNCNLILNVSWFDTFGQNPARPRFDPIFMFKPLTKSPTFN